MRSDLNERLAAEARAAWRPTVDVTTLDHHARTAVRYVEAEADTGTRYVVVATALPAGHREGGDVLVTVLWPWQDAHTMSADPGRTTAESYVAEHLCDGRDRKGNLAPEDLAALTRTVHHVLGRWA